jgi:outer membrane protein W
MKKQIIIISLLLVLSATIFAQDKKHEIVLGYGVGTHYAIVEEMAGVLGIFITLGTFNAEYESGTGAILLGYRYSAGEKFSIGIDGSYTKIKEILKIQSKPVGSFYKQFYTIAPYVAYNYIKKEKFSMYSGIGLGYTFVKDEYTMDDGGNETNNSGEFAFHLSAFGVRFGKNIGGYVEVGYGYKGLVNLGVSFKL